MAFVTIDIRQPWPDLRPGDVVFGVVSSGGVVEQLTVERATAPEAAPKRVGPFDLDGRLIV